MDVQTCIESRFSTRSYRKDAICDDILIEILNAARYAPSAKNRQPWRFAILRGDEKTFVVQQCRKDLQNNPIRTQYLLSRENATEYHTFNIIDSAPVLVLVFNAFPSEIVLDKQNVYFDSSNMLAIGASIQNMLLRATELGIGSLWVGDILSNAPFITEHYFHIGRLVAGIVLGMSDTLSRPANRLPLSELIVFNGGQE